MTRPKILLGLVLCMLGLVGLGLVLSQNTTARAAVPFNKGDVFAGTIGGKIKHFGPAGNLLETLDTQNGCSEDTGMAFDTANNLYATCFTRPSTVVKFDNRGNLLGPFGSGYASGVESVVFDAAGNIYVGQADGGGATLKFDPNGNLLAKYFFPIESRGSDWLDLASDQCTMYYTSEGSRVLRYDVCKNTPLPDFAVGLTRPLFALRILPNGEILVAGRLVVYRLSTAGAVVATYTAPGETGFFGLNLDPDGVNFWTAGERTGNVYKFAIATPALPLLTFNAILSGGVHGLAILGEITQGNPGSGTGGPTPTPGPQKPAAVPPPDIITQLRVGPNLAAALSTPEVQSVVTYTVKVKNIGMGKADNYRVEFPIDPGLELLSVDFNNDKSWVSKVVTDNATLSFGAIEGGINSPILTATVRMAVKPAVSPGTNLLRVKGYAGWGGPTLENLSNSVSFEILDAALNDPDDNQDGVQPIMATLDATKTSVTLSSSIYIPKEKISGWLNLPDGSIKSLGTGLITTDKDGLAVWSYALTGLPPGNYSIVLYGERSEVQGVGSFTIS